MLARGVSQWRAMVAGHCTGPLADASRWKVASVGLDRASAGEFVEKIGQDADVAIAVFANTGGGADGNAAA